MCIIHKWKRRTKTYQEQLNKSSNESRFFCMHKILVHAQHSCASTTLLCMHNTLVHALEGPGTKAGTQKKQPRVRPGADRKSTRLNSSHLHPSRMPSSA